MRRSAYLVAAVALLLGAGIPVVRALGRSEAPVVPAASRAAVRDQDIAFYEARVAHDRYGARDRAVLGALYLARARAQGGETDYRRAESLARESFHTRGKRNADALSILIGSLMAQHRFLDAWEVARELVTLDPAPVSRATLGEIALELGRYRIADSLFLGLSVVHTSPAVAPRYARWLELHGRSGEARDLLEQTRASLLGGFRLPPEQLSWFDLRIGDLAFRNGRGDLAEQSYRRGLALVPDDPRLLTALAQLRGAEGHWEEAIPLGEQALTSLVDPAILGLLSRASFALGDSAQAAEYARATEIAVSHQPGAFHRGWALFLLDQGRQVPLIRDRALSDLRTRKDVYGYDLAAWALYHSGQPREAMILADSALQLGTRDATLHLHAARIAAALGDSTRAALEARTAMAISPLAVALVSAP